jgi:hypothetical protein
MTTERTGRVSIDTTSLVPTDVETPLVVAPPGDRPTPLPETHAAEGTRKLKALPPPIPGRASSPTIPPPVPAVARTNTPSIRAEGTIPPPVVARALTADPDGWTVASTDDSGLRDIMALDPEAPEPVTPAPPPTQIVEPTDGLNAKPSAEWLAKIDAVLRPELAPPAPRSTMRMASPPPPFAAAPEPRSLTLPLELVDHEPAPLTLPLELVDLEPFTTPAKLDDAAAPPAPVVAPRAAFPVVAVPVAPPAIAREPAEPSFNLDMTSARTTGFDMPAQRRLLSPHIVIGIVAGAAVLTVAYLGTRGGSTQRASASAAHPATEQPKIATPAPQPPVQAVAAAAPATQEVPAATDDPNMIRMPVTSNPSGALVTFVDGDHALVVGRTPVTVWYDPRKPHDIALTLLDHETQLMTIPVGGKTALVVDLPTKVGAATPVHEQHAATRVATAETPAKQHAAPPPAHPVQKLAAPAPAPAAAPADSGMLMISSKPPCEIIVDGKSTHLMTPQRALALSAGTHTIVLVNAQAKIRKTVPVMIAAKKSTKVLQDFTAH